MFEDSLLESTGQLATGSRRWIAVGSVGLQCLLAAAVVLVPVLKPEALSFRVLAPTVIVPVLKKMPVVVERKVMVRESASSVALPRVAAASRMVAVLPSMREVDAAEDIGAAMSTNLSAMQGGGNDGSDGNLFRALGGGARAVVATKKAGGVRVSSGVSAGLLVGQIQPVYPRIAIMARVEGSVVVEATISRSGTIESAKVVSGPAMLAGAALDAVKTARYRPYLLNGEATEVQTTVTVNFRLGS